MYKTSREKKILKKAVDNMGKLDAKAKALDANKMLHDCLQFGEVEID